MPLVRSACACVLAVGLAAPARSDGPAPIRLTLRPAAAPAPALRYRLLPELREQTPGNAVEVYKQAVKVYKEIAADPAERGRAVELDRWAELPVRDLPREQVREALDKYREVFDLADKAARRERCDWGLAERLRKPGFETLLPEHGYLRGIAPLLAVRARLAVAEGRPDEALRALETGFAMGHHAGDCPSLICGLVGHAIAHIMGRQLDAFVEMSTAPNLYWALADLPRPFIDVRSALEGDRLALFATFPGLDEAAHDPGAGAMAPAQIKRAADVALRERRDAARFPNREAVALAFALDLSKKHEQAKRALVAAGRPHERVEKMPHVQVALLAGYAEYERLFDETARWHGLPFWQAYPDVKRALERGREGAKRPDGPAIPLAGRFVPLVAKELLIRARLERKVAALRCVEAVRLYAAAHGGKLPPTLADVKEVPVPHDPMTGKPFEYRVEAGKATLHAPPPGGERPDAYNTLTYELTLAR